MKCDCNFLPHITCLSFLQYIDLVFQHFTYSQAYIFELINVDIVNIKFRNIQDLEIGVIYVFIDCEEYT